MEPQVNSSTLRIIQKVANKVRQKACSRRNYKPRLREIYYKYREFRYVRSRTTVFLIILIVCLHIFKMFITFAV